MPVYWSRWKKRVSGDVRRFNVHGMFINTEHDAQLGFVLLDMTIVMPWGAIACTAVPRFVGESPDGRGIGVEFHVMDKGDRELWTTHYRRALAEHQGRG
jgi:hypothetical protein